MKTVTSEIKLPDPFLCFQSLSFPGQHLLIKAHSHPAWQLSVTLEGTFCYHMKKGTVLQNPGEWILIPPDLVHDCGAESPRSAAAQIFLRYFPSDFFSEAAQIFNLRRWQVICGKTEIRKIAVLSETIRETEKDVKIFRESKLRIFCLAFIMQCLSGMKESELPHKKIRPELLQALEYMEQHYAEPLSLRDFAEAANLPCRTFSDLFRKHLQMTPMQFFHSIRLSHAYGLLLNGVSIEETARRCGFSSPQYFCRCFRAASGVTPGSFRQHPFLYQKDDDVWNRPPI